MENKLVVTSGRGHGEGQYGARILKATNYWVGQNVHSGFLQHLMGKSEWTFWRTQYNKVVVVLNSFEIVIHKR